MVLDLVRSARILRVATQWAMRPFHPT